MIIFFIVILPCLVVTILTLSNDDLRLLFLRHVCRKFPALAPYMGRFVKNKMTHEEKKQKMETDKQKKEADRQAELQKRRDSNLSQENATLKAEVSLLRREIDNLRRELQQSAMAPAQPPQQTGSDGMIDMSDTPAAPSLRGKKLYAFNATSFSPYGFNKDDLSETFTEQLFLIIPTDDTHAELTVVDIPQKKKVLLHDLNYYGQLVEVTKRPRTEASGLYVRESGRLTLTGGVWAVEKNIKIEIV